MQLRLWIAAAVLLLSSAAPAVAESEGYITADVNLRAGPDTVYPIIDTIPAGDTVTVIGCLSDWSWCDVAWYDFRGWVYAGYVDTYYEDRRVYLPAYATLIALPVITFEFNTYWDTHYHDRYYGRRWYRDRDYWYAYWERHHHDRWDGRGDWDDDRRARAWLLDDIVTGSLDDRPARETTGARIG